MGVVVACLRCGAQLRSKDEYAGRPVRCPYCHTINQLPERPNAAPAEAERQLCPLCGGRFEPSREQVKGPRGVLYHRECFELERARWRAHQSTRSKATAASSPLITTSAAPPAPTFRPPVSTPPARPAPTPAPTPMQATPFPAPASSASQPCKLAPLEWPTGLRELLDEWEASPYGAPAATVLAPAQPSPLKRLLRRKRSLRILFGIGAAVPAMALIVMMYTMLIGTADRSRARIASTAGPAIVASGIATSPMPPGYVAIPKTDIWLLPPAGFLPSADLPGLVQSATGATVMVIEMKTPFTELRPNLESGNLTDQGTELLQQVSVTIDDQPGILVQTRRESADGAKLKWIATFGDSRRSCSLTATLPESLAADLSEVLCQTLLGAKSARGKIPDPLAELGFGLDVPPELKLAQREGEILTYTKDGTIPAAMDEPVCLIGRMPAPSAADERKSFAEQLLRQNRWLGTLDLQSNAGTMVNGLPGYEVEGFARDTSGQVSLLVYELALFDGDHCYFVQGLTSDRYGQYLAKYRTMAHSFRQR